MEIKQLAYELVHPLLGAVARNRWLINCLFDVRVPKQIVVHFDPTTLLLRRALRHTVTAADRTALEVGIGQGALLTLGLLKSSKIDVQGIDCSQARVLSSQVVAAHNGLNPRFFVSDLFGSVPPDHQFDLIFFNPPYVPTSDGQQLKLTRRMRADSDRVWDGGTDGTQVLQAFLQQAPQFLSRSGRVLFGLQTNFVPVERVESVVSASGFVVLDRVTRCCLPSLVYVLGQRVTARRPPSRGTAE